MKKRFIPIVFFSAISYTLSAFSHQPSAITDSSFYYFVRSFCNEYRNLNIPALEYDYKEYFKNIPDTLQLKKQEEFFHAERVKLNHFNYSLLEKRDKIHYDQLQYECTHNLQRLNLEKKWREAGNLIPENGLFHLNDNKEWYKLFVNRFTSLDISPEEVYNLGLSETKRVQGEINKIRLSLGFTDSNKFYDYLKNDTFMLKDKNMIMQHYSIIDSEVRVSLHRIINMDTIPKVYAMEWPDSGPNTPPGMYVNHLYNAYGKDVFEYNFYGGIYNSRCMEWLYMHEAIPGHHLQATVWNNLAADSAFQALFQYPGNFEGWACYIEYLGKDIGMYKNPYSELGKWEWDLVRSVRVVIDAGIHYYGWNHDKALAYWKSNIKGQDGIAEREITRITNWPCQVLSYKVGANEIMKLKMQYAKKEGKDYDVREFHKTYLNMGLVPLAIMEKYI